MNKRARSMRALFRNTVMKIWIFRHGETDANVKGILQGSLDTVLNENGRLLARECGEALKGISFDAAFSSPLSRAKESADILLKECGNDLPLVFDDRLKEICMGDFEGKKKDGAIKDRMDLFFKDPKDLGPFPNGEDIEGLKKRTQSFLKEIAQREYENVFVMTHGCALRAMLNFLYEDKEDFWQGHVPYNCCLNVVEVKGGIITLCQRDLILYDKDLCIDRYR